MPKSSRRIKDDNLRKEANMHKREPKDSVIIFFNIKK